MGNAMPAARFQNVIHCLRTAVTAGDSHAAPDADLLARYATTRDDSAFELLVWRHSRMVLGVCRRVLRHEQDAHDAFQATFLALARRARAIGRGESVGGWLHKVACRAALRARVTRGRHAARLQPLEGLTVPSANTDPCLEAAGRELRALLDEQVSRLPAKYRAVFVLRCLAGKSSAEAARELRCPVGTVESRLVRARARLRAALVRRGFIVPAGLLATGLSDGAFAAGVPAALVGATSRAATLYAAGQAAAGVAVAAQAAALAEGVLKAMLLTKLKIGAAVLLVLGALALAGSEVVYRTQAADPQQVSPRAGQQEGRLDSGGARGTQDRLETLQDQIEELARRLRERRELLAQQDALQRQLEEVLRVAAPGPMRDREVERLKGEREQLRRRLVPELQDGVITEVTSGGRVQVGLRREDGARPGDLLHVFRLEPRPEYLGRVKVLQVEGAAAVGKVVGQVGLIRAGDLTVSGLPAGAGAPDQRPAAPPRPDGPPMPGSEGVGAAKQDGRTPYELIRAATTRPWPGESYPVLPAISTAMRGFIAAEMNLSPAVRAAYEKLDAARQRNVTWFEGLTELERAKAVWCLASCLCHPSSDVQLRALRGLERLGDKKAVAFLALYAEHMAVVVQGSETATIHAAIHAAAARTLSALTGVEVAVRGQDPAGLLRGVRLWRRWLCEQKE
jgi:RNA polymerase sigma factor (sigma-70 family)